MGQTNATGAAGSPRSAGGAAGCDTGLTMIIVIVPRSGVSMSATSFALPRMGCKPAQPTRHANLSVGVMGSSWRSLQERLRFAGMWPRWVRVPPVWQEGRLRSAGMRARWVQIPPVSLPGRLAVDGEQLVAREQDAVGARARGRADHRRVRIHPPVVLQTSTKDY